MLVAAEGIAASTLYEKMDIAVRLRPSVMGLLHFCRCHVSLMDKKGGVLSYQLVLASFVSKLHLKNCAGATHRQISSIHTNKIENYRNGSFFFPFSYIFHPPPLTLPAGAARLLRYLFFA